MRKHKITGGRKTLIVMGGTLVFLSLFFLMPLKARAQLEASNWYFGNKAGLNFEDCQDPSVLTDGQLVQEEGCASISDSEGNLLFYTDGQVVYNANHEIMPNGTGLLGDQSSSQSAIIIPKPGDETSYYIFTTDKEAGSDGLNYSVVD